MNTFLRVSVNAVAVVVAGLGLSLAYTGGLSSFGSDLCSLPRVWVSNDAEVERRAHLDRECAAALARVAAKLEIVNALVDERMTLVAAARQLCALAEATPPQLRKYAREAFASSSNDSALCLQTIAYVRAELSSEPALAARVTTRLEKELPQKIDA